MEQVHVRVIAHDTPTLRGLCGRLWRGECHLDVTGHLPACMDRTGRLGFSSRQGPRVKGMPVHDAIKVALQPTGPGSCRVSVAGELDVLTAPEVRTALRTALADHRHVVIDLSELRFCDCSGLTVLLATARTARHHGVDLRLCAVPRFLARIMRLTGTHGSFAIDSAPQSGR